MRPYRRGRRRAVTAPALEIPADASPKLREVFAIYTGSDGDATSALYRRLEQFGVAGIVAVNVFRAQKASERAKRYRGGTGGQSYRAMAYQRKQWSLENVAKALGDHALALGLTWGWGEDDKLDAHRHVLYIDLPTGQVSWHGERRGAGPDYLRAWDGIKGASTGRILRWVADLLQRYEEDHD